MAVELINSNKRSVRTIGSLEDGQIAVVIEGPYFGEVVQRWSNNCIVIGKGYDQGWSGCSNNKIEVRLLEDGELIKVFNNK